MSNSKSIRMNYLLESLDKISSDLSSIRSIIKSLQVEGRRLRNIYKEDQYFSDNLFMIEELECTTPTWLLVTHLADTKTADRRGSMLTGPLFTCEEYPWPLNDKEPMLSMMQIDLRVPSKLSGLIFGDGLLQIFINPDLLSWLIRVVPRDIVINSELTDIPEFGEFDFSLISTDWIGSNGKYPEIVGLSEPKISSAVDFKGEWIPPDLPEEIRLFLDKINKVAGNSWGSNRLFGTFDLIQYSPLERPPCLMFFD